MIELTSKSQITYDPTSLIVDGNRWFPVMGEIHYSRVKADTWERELLKMKAGGVDVVSCYSIWIHHEEIRGEFDFTGDRSLRAFMEAVKRCGLHCILRIGPWAHGEARNGGFPDWLVQLEKAGELTLRKDDPKYLGYVRQWYTKLFEQVDGLLLKDDGPIIGIQIENEYGHCGGFGGEVGEQHMRTLEAMAKEIGFDAPIYTATGWGGAITAGMLPVMGGYCEAPWDQRLTEIEPSSNYVFTAERNDHGIGSDHGLGAGVTFDMTKYPFLTAELGGGLQVTRHRRPIATGKDTEAMSIVKMGCGCNLLGYYMYHGGTNPQGKLTSLQESRATGYPNDLPVKSYDFNAPIREYGQLTDTYRRLRRLSMFVHDFGSDLCEMEYVEQPGNTDKADNLTALRTSVRCMPDGKSGYFFVNNYQRRYPMAEHVDVELKAYSATREVEQDGVTYRGRKVLADFGTETIADGETFFRPFGMKLGNAVLKTTNATPLCKLSGETETFVFYTPDDKKAVYEVEGDMTGVSIVTLTAEESLHAVKAVIDGTEVLLISDGDVVREADGGHSIFYTVEGEVRPEFKAMPALVKCPEGFEVAGEEHGFTVYRGKEVLQNSLKTTVSGETEADGSDLMDLIRVEGIEDEMDEAMLYIDYEAEAAEMYHGPKLIADNFYTGQPWEIGVKQFAMDGMATVSVLVHALYEEMKIYLQNWPEMKNGCACRVKGLRTAAVIKVKL